MCAQQCNGGQRRQRLTSDLLAILQHIDPPDREQVPWLAARQIEGVFVPLKKAPRFQVIEHCPSVVQQPDPRSRSPDQALWAFETNRANVIRYRLMTARMKCSGGG